MTEQEYKKAIQSLEKALGKSKPEDISYLWIAGIGQILPPKHKNLTQQNKKDK